MFIVGLCGIDESKDRYLYFFEFTIFEISYHFVVGKVFFIIKFLYNIYNNRKKIISISNQATYIVGFLSSHAQNQRLKLLAITS